MSGTYYMFGSRLQDYPDPANNLEQVGRRFVEMWNELEQNGIISLVLSMSHRCQAIIRNRGGNTFIKHFAN